MVKNLSFPSFFFKTTKDTNGPGASYKNQIAPHSQRNSCHDQNLISKTITDENDATFDPLKGVDLTESDRLLFEPGCSTKSIMEAAGVKAVEKNGTVVGSFKGGVAMAMESKDPFRDFRESMEQMVMAHGVKDWDWLQEMLRWHLRANEKRTHGMIVGAFVDLLMSLGCSSSSNLSNRISSCSSCSCFSFEIEEGITERR